MGGSGKAYEGADLCDEWIFVMSGSLSMGRLEAFNRRGHGEMPQRSRRGANRREAVADVYKRQGVRYV